LGPTRKRQCVYILVLAVLTVATILVVSVASGVFLSNLVGPYQIHVKAGESTTTLAQTTSTSQTQTASTTTTTVASTTTASTMVTVSITVTLGTTLTTMAQKFLMQVASNSSISGLIFDSTKGLLDFTVSGPTGSSGFFDATIAKNLLSGQPIVLIDGVERSASVSQDPNFWYVHVTYPHSEHHVTIGGSNTIPEFPSAPLLILILMLVMIVLRRRPHKVSNAATALQTK